MAQRAKAGGAKLAIPRSRTFGNAAVTAKNQFEWVWSHESLLRLALSLILALALWLYVTDRQDPTQAWDYQYPLSITYQNLNPRYTVTNNLAQIHVRIRANRNTTLVTPTSFHTFVDLTNYKPGQYRVPVNVLPDPNISVLQKTPSSVLVDIESLKEKNVPIVARFYNRPPTGYIAGDARIDPGSISVSGPSNSVAQVARAVAYLDLSTARSSLTGTYRLSLENTFGRTVSDPHLSMSQSETRVTVPISASTSFKTLPIVASIRGTPRPGFGVAGVTVQPPEITAQGSASLLSKVISVTTSPVWVTNRGSGTFTKRVKLSLRNGITSSNSWVTVTTQINSVDSSSSIEIGISPQNVAPGLSVHIHPGKVLVTIVGPSTALRSAARHMSAGVNVFGLNAGTYGLRPHVTVPRGLQVESVYPPNVSVVISNGSRG